MAAATVLFNWNTCGASACSLFLLDAVLHRGEKSAAVRQDGSFEIRLKAFALSD